MMRELAFASPDRETFLRGYCPRSLDLPLDPRKSSNEDILELQRLTGRREWWSYYWTFYSFREYDDSYRNTKGEKVGRVDYDSAVLDRAVVEIEHHDCGVLCDHTLEETKHLVSWSRKQDIVPTILYSGGKSFHVLFFYPEVSCPDEKKQEVTKQLGKTIINGASLNLADENVTNVGTRVISRIPETFNSTTGYRCATLPGESFEKMTISDVLATAKEDPDPAALQKVLEGGEQSAALGRVVEELAEKDFSSPDHNYSSSTQQYSPCSTIRKLLRSPAPRGKRYYATLAIVDHCRSLDKSSQECFETLKRWAARTSTTIPSWSKVRRDVDYRYRNGDEPNNPCAWLVNVGYHCPDCLR